MKTKGPVWCRPKDVGTANQEYWRKKWKNGSENRGPNLGWSKTRILMRDIKKAMMPRNAKG